MTPITRRGLLAAAGATALAAPLIQRARAEEAVLNVYNWVDYIGETTIEDFQSATGISVTYDMYSSSEEMAAKVLAGSTGYDVVVMAGWSIPEFVKAEVLHPIDRAKLPNWKNLDPEILGIVAGWDPGNQHGVPYFWGSVGVSYNVDLVRARIPDADFSSLDLLFKPELAARLADCGISVLDSPTDIMLMALKYLGIDGDTTNPEDYRKVVELFRPVRQYIRTFDNTNYLNAIPNGELCVINSWSGDYATANTRAEEAGLTLNLAYQVPVTGAPLWADCLSIPADARQKDNAHRFIDYLMDPEVIARCTAFTNYANANLAAKPFIDPAILGNPAVYPDEAVIKRLWAPKPLSPELDRAINRAWQEIKAG